MMREPKKDTLQSEPTVFGTASERKILNHFLDHRRFLPVARVDRDGAVQHGGIETFEISVIFGNAAGSAAAAAGALIAAVAVPQVMGAAVLVGVAVASKKLLAPMVDGFKGRPRDESELSLRNDLAISALSFFRGACLVGSALGGWVGSVVGLGLGHMVHHAKKCFAPIIDFRRRQRQKKVDRQRAQDVSCTPRPSVTDRLYDLGASLNRRWNVQAKNRGGEMDWTSPQPPKIERPKKPADYDLGG